MEQAEGREIWFLNRDVLVVRPAQPFVAWAVALDDEDAITPGNVEGASNSFLIPEFEYDEETWAWVEANAEIMFEYMLHDWSTDPSEWPEDRGWEAFQSWFSYEHIALAWDLVDEPLSSEPPADGDDEEDEEA